LKFNPMFFIFINLMSYYFNLAISYQPLAIGD